MYLNMGTVGIVAKPVLDKIIEASASLEGGGLATYSKFYPEVEKSRERIAQLLGAQAEEIAFTNNATDGVNLVISSLTWQPDDEVVISNQEHPAMLYPWTYLHQRCSSCLKFFEVDPDPQETLENVRSALTPKTRLIGTSQVSTQTGIRVPVEEICDLARERGILTLIDGAQAVGQFPIDVKKMGCDFYTTNGHKWLCGPKGTGMFYVNKDRIEELLPIHVGAGSECSFSMERGLELKHSARCFEYGTRDIVKYVGLSFALDWLEGLGWNNIEARLKELSLYLKDRVMELSGTTLYTPYEWELSSAMIAFSMEGFNARELSIHLKDEWKIFTRVVDELNGLRISTAYFNTEEEIDFLLKKLQKVINSHRDKVGGVVRFAS